MDPVLLGLVLLLLTMLITFVIYKIVTRESSFESAYGNSAFRLLSTQSQEKTKSKQKVFKAKKSAKFSEKKDEIELETVLNECESQKTFSSPQRNLSENTKSFSRSLSKSDQRNEKKKNEEKSSNAINNVPKNVQSNGELKSFTNSVFSEQEKFSENKTLTQRCATIDEVIDHLRHTYDDADYLANFISAFAKAHKNNETKLNCEIESLKKNLAEKDKNLKQLTSQQEKSKSERDRLSLALKDQTVKTDELKKNLKAKISELSQLAEEKIRLNNCFTQAQAKLKDVGLLSQQYDLLRVEFAKLKSIAKEENQKWLASKNLSDKLSIELNVANQRLDEKNIAKNIYESKIESLANELDAEKEKHLQIMSQISLQKDQLNQELDRIFAAYTSVSGQQAKSKSENEELQKQFSFLQSEIEMWKDRAQKVSVNFERVKPQIQSMSEQSEVLQLRNGDLEKENNFLNEKLKRFEANLIELKAIRKKSERDDKLIEEISSKNKKLETESMQMTDNLSADFEALKEKSQNLTNEVSNQKLRNNELREMNFKLLDTVEQLQKRASDPKIFSSDANSSDSLKLRSEVNIYKSALEDLKIRLDVVGEIAQRMEMEKEELAEKLKSCTCTSKF